MNHKPTRVQLRRGNVIQVYEAHPDRTVYRMVPRVRETPKGREVRVTLRREKDRAIITAVLDAVEKERAA